MNKVMILAASTILVLAGCGDKDESATGDAAPSMLEKTMDATKGAVKDTGSAVSEMADDATGAVGSAY
ncbi:MAG: hypothetical protein WBN51_01230, partial [Gammaproteobacteria bacterium]